MPSNVQKPRPVRAAIVAMTREHVISIDGKIPWHYPVDLQHFKQRTMHATVVMGRKTWDSIGPKALSGRHNIVISRRAWPAIPSQNNVTFYTTVAAALSACTTVDTWIIGGGEIYQQALAWVEQLDVTYVPSVPSVPAAVYFPPIDAHRWRVESSQLLASPSLTNGELMNVVYRRIHRRIH